MLEKLGRRRGEEGFTLIELLIVIVILGILSAIVVFAVGGITNKGANSACKSDYKVVEAAQETQKAQTGSYAASTAALVTANLMKSVPNQSTYDVTTSATGDIVVTSPKVAPTATSTNSTTACPA